MKTNYMLRNPKRRILSKSRLLAITSITLGALVFLTSVSEAGVGLVFGNLQPATTVGAGLYSFGAAASAGDNVTTVNGDFAYGFGMFTEGRIRLGVSEISGPNTDPTVALGGEFKYQFWNFRGQGSSGNSGDPFDLAFSGMFEYASFDNVSVTAFGVNVLGSLPFVGKKGRVYGPYGRFNVRLSTVSPAGPVSSTDIKFAFTPGFMVQLTRQARAFGEINIDENTGVSVGVQFGSY
jgi:hypothetical protein